MKSSKSMADKKISSILITGYIGSGNTTLMQILLKRGVISEDGIYDLLEE